MINIDWFKFCRNHVIFGVSLRLRYTPWDESQYYLDWQWRTASSRPWYKCWKWNEF